MSEISLFKSTLRMYPQNPLTKTRGKSLFSCDDAYVEVSPLVILPSVYLPKACGLRGQAWPRFCLTSKQVMKSVNLPKAHGSRNQT